LILTKIKTFYIIILLIITVSKSPQKYQYLHITLFFYQNGFYSIVSTIKSAVVNKVNNNDI